MRKTITYGVALVAVMFLNGTATAQMQDKPQQKCINALNKGMVKVASAQTKANSKCSGDFAKGKNMNAVTCWNTSTKVDTAQTKNCESETKKCTTPPNYGKTSCGNVNNYAEYNGGEFASDIFGQADPNAGITLCGTDKPGCKCQAKAMKAANKLYATYMKTYNKCKKSGLKDKVAPITAVAGLDACMSVDPKLKIDKAGNKLAGAITKKCGTVANAFPGGVCTGLTGQTLADCIEERVRCRVCITTDASDDLGVDCDLFDDGNVEGSCFDEF